MHIQLPLWFLVVGRILFVSYFMAMGTSHLLKFQEHSAHLARKGVPLPRAATILTVIMMVGGGVWFYSIGTRALERFCCLA